MFYILGINLLIKHDIHFKFHLDKINWKNLAYFINHFKIKNDKIFIVKIKIKNVNYLNKLIVNSYYYHQ